MNIFTSSRADPSLIAEVHYHYADALAQRGDYDRAIEHAQKCRKMRESCFGFSDGRVIHSCRQVAKLLLAPYKDYHGVLTPVVRNAYREAISCHEKVFRYLQNMQGLSRRKSMRKSFSQMSLGGISTTNSSHPIAEVKLSIAGPLVVPPFGWTSPFAKNLMHRLTKEIVSMKLALVDVPSQKECIRMQRFKLQSNNGDFDSDDAKEIIVRMAAVTPSVYLDDVLQRIGLGDESAIHELGLILILTESETVGMRT